MKYRHLLAFALLAVLFSGTGYTYFQNTGPGENMTQATEKFLASLNEKQRAQTQLDFDTPKRLDWHFIPKDYRKGLQIKEMSQGRRKSARAILKSALSEMGYGKAVKIMELEKVLHQLEGGKGRWARDHERYYFTVFGKPAADSKWGISIEGHHLSFNFVVDHGKVVSSSPQFFAANPALVQGDYIPEVKQGTRVLAKEELTAFELVNSLSDEQKKKAIIAEKAPAEIRTPGSAQPPTDAAEGISVADLNGEQRGLLRQIVQEYVRAVPREVAQQRIDALRNAGTDKIYFAWAGATKPGVGHYYKIQGPTFLIEFVNTQPDAAGNPANHIHCVWRNMAGDFGLPIGK